MRCSGDELVFFLMISVILRVSHANSTTTRAPATQGNQMRGEPDLLLGLIQEQREENGEGAQRGQEENDERDDEREEDMAATSTIDPWACRDNDEGTPCTWAEWAEWSYCSHPCGGLGTQSRSRLITAHERCGGAPCRGRSVQRQDCNRFCMNEGRLVDGRCQCLSNYLGQCCQEKVEWDILLRMTAGGGSVSPFYLWTSTLEGNLTDNGLQTVADLPKGVYKSPRVENWKFSKIKMSFYTGGEEVAYFIFKASSNKTAWLTKDNIIDSIYSDVEAKASNSISFTREFCLRRLELFQRPHPSCSFSSGWMLVKDLGSKLAGATCSCPFDINIINRMPMFVYSDKRDPENDSKKLISNYISKDMRQANVLVIFGV